MLRVAVKAGARPERPAGAASRSPLPALPWYLLAAAVVALDQWTKALALRLLEHGEPVSVTGFFNLTLLYNRGAAFSLLSDAGGWQHWLFSGIALLVAALISVWLYRLPARARLEPLALALVLGGALGNLIDRLRFGHVVDFIQLHYRELYWPAFNLADSAITLGAGLLILLVLRGGAAGRR
jgi:signal peptidase II